MAISAPEDAIAQALDEIASHECTCKEAQAAFIRKQKMEAAQEYINNLADVGAAQALAAGVKLCMDYAIDKMTVKSGITQYTVFLDKEGNIGIKSKKTYSDEEKF